MKLRSKELDIQKNGDGTATLIIHGGEKQPTRVVTLNREELARLANFIAGSL